MAANCIGCHGGNVGSGAVIATDEHTEHVNKLAYLGSNFACGRCHSTVVSTANDRAVPTSGIPNHVNGVRDVPNNTDVGTWSSARWNAQQKPA